MSLARGIHAGVALQKAYQASQDRAAGQEMSAIMAEIKQFNPSGSREDGATYNDMGDRLAQAAAYSPETMAQAHEFWNLEKARRITESGQAAILASQTGNAEAVHSILRGMGAFIFPDQEVHVEAAPDGSLAMSTYDEEGYSGGVAGVSPTPEGLTQLMTSLTEPETYWKLIQQNDQFNQRMGFEREKFEFSKMDADRRFGLAASRARGAGREKKPSFAKYDDVWERASGAVMQMESVPDEEVNRLTSEIATTAIEISENNPLVKAAPNYAVDVSIALRASAAAAQKGGTLDDLDLTLGGDAETGYTASVGGGPPVLIKPRTMASIRHGGGGIPATE